MNDSKVAGMWNNRYGETGYAYGNLPNDFLKSMAKHIPQGKVLCLGAGEGRNAVYLSQLGYDVTAVDISAVGLNKAQQLAKQKNVRINTIQTNITDFEINNDHWQGIISIFFHIQPELRRTLHKDIIAGLMSGGVFILEGYSIEQLQYKTGGPPVKELLFDHRKLVDELHTLELVISRKIVRTVVEGKYHTGEGSVIQILGQKTG